MNFWKFLAETKLRKATTCAVLLTKHLQKTSTEMSPKTFQTVQNLIKRPKPRQEGARTPETRHQDVLSVHTVTACPSSVQRPGLFRKLLQSELLPSNSTNVDQWPEKLWAGAGLWTFRSKFWGSLGLEVWEFLCRFYLQDQILCWFCWSGEIERHCGLKSSELRQFRGSHKVRTF